MKTKRSCHTRSGNLGEMYPLGSQVTTTEAEELLSTNVIGLQVQCWLRLFQVSLIMGYLFPPWHCNPCKVLAREEQMYGNTAMKYMEKSEPNKTMKLTSSNPPPMSSRVSLTIVCYLHNLSNSSHYDVNDWSAPGYAVWTESGWFYLFCQKMAFYLTKKQV